MNPLITTIIIIIILLTLFGEKMMMKFNEIFWSKEMPEKIIGLEVRLVQFDGLGPNPIDELSGSVLNFKDGAYRVDLDESIILDGKKENYVYVSARHSGYPVSKISKLSIFAVGGSFESGRRFISLIEKK